MNAQFYLLLSFNRSISNSIAKFLNKCQAETGGFGGGPGQIAHLATSYAAINALCTLNSERALKIINVEALLGWIKRLKMDSGAFRMHENGEEDLRYFIWEKQVGFKI